MDHTIKEIALIHKCVIDVDRITTGTEKAGFHTYEIIGIPKDLKKVKSDFISKFPELKNNVNFRFCWFGEGHHYLEIQSIYVSK